MVQSAASRGLDFTAAELRGRWWWLKARWILDLTEEQEIINILKLQFNQHLAVLDYTLSEQAFNHHWDGANSLINDLRKLIFPWQEGLDKKPKTDVNKLIEDWKSIYGDLSDPKVKKRFDRVADAIKNKYKTAKTAQSAAEIKKREMQQKLTNLAKKRRRR